MDDKQIDQSLDPEARGIPISKRVLDVTCVVLALPLLGPLMMLLGISIKCMSGGPVLFVHERVGYRGRKFLCFKFRTMKVDTDSEIHRQHLTNLMKSNAPMVKMDSKGDPRLIPFGSILRATGLDELPQLLNVLAGEMSLVGPRPCLPYEYDSYLPSQRRRFDTLPGLTGLWQVSGKNRTTFSEMIAFDIEYSKSHSPWLDLKIMFKTPVALLMQIMEKHDRKASHTTARRVVGFILSGKTYRECFEPAYYDLREQYLLTRTGCSDSTRRWMAVWFFAQTATMFLECLIGTLQRCALRLIRELFFTK